MSIDLTPALDLLRREIPGLAAVYLFGSMADGAGTPQSDVDLAIFAGSAVDRARLLDVQEAAAKVLGRDVDLVDLAQASTVLQVQAIGEGRQVEVCDPDAAAFFEIRVMRDYQDLKARRAEMEAGAARRGRVYG